MNPRWVQARESRHVPAGTVRSLVMTTGLLQTLLVDIAGVTNLHYQRWAENAGCIMKRNPHDFLDGIDTVVVPVQVHNNHYVPPPWLWSLHFPRCM